MITRTRAGLAALGFIAIVTAALAEERNVWELAPQIDPAASLLAFEGTLPRPGRTDKTPAVY